MARCSGIMRWMSIVVVLGLFAPAWGAAGKDLVKTKLAADVKEVKAGEPFHVGLVLTIKKGWHIYWKNPGDSGAATTAALKAPEGFKVGEWQFPVPSKIADPGGNIYGYEDEVMLVTTVTPPGNYSAGSAVDLSCDATWLVCEKVCLMGKGSATLSLPGADDNAELFKKWLAMIPTVAERANVSVKSSGEGTNQKWSGTVKVKVPEGATKAQWFPGPSETVAMKDVHVKENGNEVEIDCSAERIGDVKKPAGTIESVLAYTDSSGSRVGVTVPVSFEAQSASAR